MYRTNAQSRAIEEAFVRYGVQYRLVAGTRFYERREVKDVVAYLRLIQNPNDDVSLMRVINIPARGIGETTQGKLTAMASAAGSSAYEALRRLVGPEEGTPAAPSPFSRQTTQTLTAFFSLIEGLAAEAATVDVVGLFDRLIERSGYKRHVLAEPQGEERWDTVMELRTVAEQFRDVPPPDGLAAFLEGVALISDVDSMEEGTPAVTLITLHQAKGLEFPVVFMVGLEEGLLPHFRSLDDPAQMEEERRLAYVGITRGKKMVYLVRALRRTLMGRTTANPPSRFLTDIPSSTAATSWWQGGQTGGGSVVEAVYSWNRPASPPPPRAPALDLKAGDKVRHSQFGNGIVVGVRAVKDDTEVSVVFNKQVKKLLLSFAKLERTE
jgi:DNA helicase-2/ATP-dependent DNA helicase PcrA